MKRRQFLTHSCGLGVAAATASSTILQLGLTRHAAAQQSAGYRAMVCILLAGGNDSFNMVVPTDADQYAEYAAIRSDLALTQESLLPLSGFGTEGRSYGVHPGMPELQSLYANGDAAVVANVGTLLEAFDATAVENGTAQLPLGLFSHADQINQWQTAVADGRIAQGWAGRVADIFTDVNVNNGISMNISLSGTNVFQSGVSTNEYSIESTGNGGSGINSYNEDTFFGDLRRRMLDGMLAVPQENLLKREYSKRLRGAIDAQGEFASALGGAPVIASPFSANPFSQALRQIARVISVRERLGASRQTFFITVGGWDHHDDVIEKQAGLLPLVSKGFQEFRDALVELNAFNDVTTFTTSDFGRTLTSNGKGSDHGWGGHHVVMGGGVNGGQMFGAYPELAQNSPLDVGRGVYAPTTSVDQYFAELALWFGVARSDLDQILPGVRRFYSPESGAPPLGFLSI